MKFKEIKKETKRRIYALALAAIMVVLPKTRAYAEDVNISETIDIDKAIGDLVPPDPTPTPTPTPEPTPAPTTEPTPAPTTEPTPAPTTEPTKPTNPTKPSEPTSPSKPTDPTVPTTEPTHPSETPTPTTNNNNNNVNQNNNSKCNHKYNDVADDVINQVAPSCTKGGSYDELYYCTECGETKIIHYTIEAPGHKWGPEHRENENELGYDLVRECTNKGCHEEWRIYIPKTPTEPTKATEPTKPTEPTNPDVPKTGDDFPLELMEAVCGISALGLPIASYQLYKVLEEEKKQKKQAFATYVENEYKGKYLSKR